MSFPFSHQAVLSFSSCRPLNCNEFPRNTKKIMIQIYRFRDMDKLIGRLLWQNYKVRFTSSSIASISDHQGIAPVGSMLKVKVWKEKLQKLLYDRGESKLWQLRIVKRQTGHNWLIVTHGWSGVPSGHWLWAQVTPVVTATTNVALLLYWAVASMQWALVLGCII